MTRLDLFTHARQAVARLQSDHPTSRPVLSILRQLDYLIAIEEGRETNRERLHEIVIGLLAVREIEPLDLQTAELLHQVSSEVEHMK